MSTTDKIGSNCQRLATHGIMRRLANEYRAWERLCREQAARADTELARQGLERSAEYCRSVADDIERADRWTQAWTHL